MGDGRWEMGDGRWEMGEAVFSSWFAGDGRQGDQAKEILVVDACGARQNLHNEQNFFMG